MIHYYTNREISEKLEINLARWKRWSRSFLPPDPLGGMQSGYARQYVFKDLFKVFLGGHLLAHLKLSVPDSCQVLVDLSPWLKKNGFFDFYGTNGAVTDEVGRFNGYRIYFCRRTQTGAKNGSGFCYYIRKTVSIESHPSANGRHFLEMFEATTIHTDAVDGSDILGNPDVRMINLTALLAVLGERLNHRPP